VTGRHRDDAFDGSPPADPLMRMTAVPIGAALVMDVVGELDLHTAPNLMAAVDDALARPGLTLLIIDLSGVSFLGSSGLGVLANLATRATTPNQASVPLRIVAPAEHRPVARPWEAMNLHQILPLYPDVEAALTVRAIRNRQGRAGGAAATRTRCGPGPDPRDPSPTCRNWLGPAEHSNNAPPALIDVPVGSEIPPRARLGRAGMETSTSTARTSTPATATQASADLEDERATRRSRHVLAHIEPAAPTGR
jgi:anti-sigma B factor antagonist